MPRGDGFTDAERQRIDRAIRDAETVCRYEFSVFVGPSGGDPRGFAERLHAGLVSPDRSVLVLVDPAARALEVVTGRQVRHELDDRGVGLAVLEMQTDFAAGDLVEGIARGLAMLAEHARQPPALRTR